MSTPPRAPRAPRTRSAFAAAFLSAIFPGLGHAYAGAWMRALAWAAVPLLTLALFGGIFLRADRIELLGFVVQTPVLIGLLLVNIGVLVYRAVAAVDAWNVARFLNNVDASGSGRAGRARIPINPLSVGGLLAVILVMAGGHIVVAHYNLLAMDLVNCVFSEDEDPSCQEPADTPDPGDSTTANASESASPAPTDSPDVVPSPIASGAVGTQAPSLPPWDGKERLNILLVGVDQRNGDAFFNTDTLIVASIDPQTKEVAMFQVPRDTVDVPVPANARPVWGSVYRGKINSWFAQNRVRPDLWAGANAQTRGFNALKSLLGGLYGLDIRYYVMANFQGFRDAVNTLGGVQVNVQIPVAESDYPVAGGVTRIYIPAGPQHMGGADALIYARSRHRAIGGDFDRGRRQQRVLVSLREQMNVSSIMANFDSLVQTMKQSIKTDIPVGQIPKLLSLASSVDTKNIRSYVFSPSYYGSDGTDPQRGYIIEPNVARIRRAVKDAFSTPAALLALRDRLGAEAARVWVVNGSGRSGLSASTADKLAYDGLDASAPNQRPATQSATKIVIYNGAEDELPETIKYLQNLFNVTVTTATDPKVPVDMVITLGRDAPNLSIDPVG
ncbi:MAG TPA: LCP family protein, partial [Candidatus Limnocylindrales bacterium]|jgi:LCP family protein required for cell wall assembly